MGDIIDFKTKKKIPNGYAQSEIVSEEAEWHRVWVCNCESQTFFLYEDGHVQCASCDAYMDSIKGFWDPEKK